RVSAAVLTVVEHAEIAGGQPRERDFRLDGELDRVDRVRGEPRTGRHEVQAHEARAPVDARDAALVVAVRADDPRDVAAVPVLVLRSRIANREGSDCRDTVRPRRTGKDTVPEHEREIR